ncbi:MAG: hypothetical protein JWL91_2118 [Sphingomonas bacterium]|nr:hypothetical protein [Sphingomonas bacterium]
MERTVAIAIGWPRQAAAAASSRSVSFVSLFIRVPGSHAHSAQFRYVVAVPGWRLLAFAAAAGNSGSMDHLRRIAKPLFWAALLFAYVAAIMPAGQAPKIAQSDKIEHMIAFFTLAFLSRLAFRATSAAKVALLLAGFGALIEFTQMIPALHRDGNVADWIADCAAIATGLLFAVLTLRTAKQMR